MTKNEIINLIPSISLKEAIKRDGYKPNDYLLFKIGYLYSKNLFDRLRICKLFMDSEMKDEANDLYNHLAKGFNSFKERDSDTIYEIKINEGKCDYSYLAITYDDAISKANAALLYDYIDNGIDPSTLTFYIVKRRVLPATNPSWMEDIVDILWLNKALEPENTYFSSTANDEINDYEDELTDLCSWNNIAFPKFFKNGDIVKLENGYGVIRYDQDKYKDAMAYIVVLSSDNIDRDIYKMNDEGYYDVLANHIHVPFTDIDIIDYQYVPDIIKKRYDKFMKFYNWYLNK